MVMVMAVVVVVVVVAASVVKIRCHLGFNFQDRSTTILLPVAMSNKAKAKAHAKFIFQARDQRHQARYRKLYYASQTLDNGSGSLAEVAEAQTRLDEYVKAVLQNA